MFISDEGTQFLSLCFILTLKKAGQVVMLSLRLCIHLYIHLHPFLLFNSRCSEGEWMVVKWSPEGSGKIKWGLEEFKWSTVRLSKCLIGWFYERFVDLMKIWVLSWEFCNFQVPFCIKFIKSFRPKNMSFQYIKDLVSPIFLHHLLFPPDVPKMYKGKNYQMCFSII